MNVWGQLETISENMQRGDPWNIFENFQKYAKGGPLEKKIFCFLFNTVFYSGIPKETIRMPFRGLTMLKSRKLVIKGGLCYRFAMVRVKENGVHIIGFDGKHLKIREVEQDSNGHYHQVKNVVDTIGQFCRFSISYYLSN